MTRSLARFILGFILWASLFVVGCVILATSLADRTGLFTLPNMIAILMIIIWTVWSFKIITRD